MSLIDQAENYLDNPSSETRQQLIESSYRVDQEELIRAMAFVLSVNQDDLFALLFPALRKPQHQSRWFLDCCEQGMQKSAQGFFPYFRIQETHIRGAISTRDTPFIKILVGHLINTEGNLDGKKQPLFSADLIGKVWAITLNDLSLAHHMIDYMQEKGAHKLLTPVILMDDQKTLQKLWKFQTVEHLSKSAIIACLHGTPNCYQLFYENHFKLNVTQENWFLGAARSEHLQGLEEKLPLLKPEDHARGIHAALIANKPSSMHYILKLIQKNKIPLDEIDAALFIELKYYSERYALCKSELDKLDLEQATTNIKHTIQTRRI